MITAEQLAIVIAALAAVSAVVLKVWPILKALFLDSAAFTKKMHDEYCGMRLDGLRQRLTAIEAHEKEAKDAVREIWARLDTVVDQIHANHADILTAINGIKR